MALGGMRKSWLSWASWRWRVQKLGAGKKPAVGPVTATGSSVGPPSAKVPALHPCQPLGLPPCWPPTVGGPLGHQLYPSALRLMLPVVLASWLSLRRVTRLCGELIFLLWQALDFCMPGVLKFHCVRGSRRLGTSSAPRPLVLPSCSSPPLLELISTIKPFTATCFPHGCHLPRPLMPADCL